MLAGVIGLVGLALAATLVSPRDEREVETGASASTTTRPSGSVTSTSTSSTTTAPPGTTTVTSPSGEPAIAVRRGDPSRRVVALTFDAGSDVGNASAILDTLGAEGIKAAFGVTGRWAEDHPDLVARMAGEGHQLLNHSYDHPSFTGVSSGLLALSRTQRLDLLSRSDSAIRAATGHTSAPWFRPPYGDEDASVRADVASAGYRYEVMWTVDSLGWKGADVDDIVARCLDGAQNGVIYLFHVGAESADGAALQRVIDGLRAAGYGFATVAEVL